MITSNHLPGSGRNFMVPMPRFASWDAFNDYLEEQCLKRQGDILRGHKVSIGARLDADLGAMQALPAAPFEACDLQSGQVTSTSMVRYRGNDYSVPVAYGHREVWIKGFVGRVVIGCVAEVIADHPRSYKTDDMVYDPLHYLPLIERKIMAFDQAAPLQGWELPKAFGTLQRLLEARQGKTGKREYVQVLRLLEHFEMEALHGAIKDALRLGALSFPSHGLQGQTTAGQRTPSSIWCCAGWSGGQHGWTWTFIRFCLVQMWPQHLLHPT